MKLINSSRKPWIEVLIPLRDSNKGFCSGWGEKCSCWWKVFLLVKSVLVVVMIDYHSESLSKCHCVGLRVVFLYCSGDWNDLSIGMI